MVLLVRRLLIGGSPFQGRCPTERLTMDPVQKTQSTLRHVTALETADLARLL